MKYKCEDWYGRLKSGWMADLKQAVQLANLLRCEVRDEKEDIIYSSWDGWNSDYPDIEKICFPIKQIA